ncbi:hypothetical protein ACIHCQ_32390 [Streptomyces sp. NPDC052236]|uniref:hypothetical protein n=1 Tax=Streptomyces sp. NPDC052236 TaxID=3365686 RepID=UPI0037D2A1D2
MTRVQPTDEEWEFTGPYLPIAGYGPCPERLRQQFEGVLPERTSFGYGGAAKWRDRPRQSGATSESLHH